MMTHGNNGSNRTSTGIALHSRHVCLYSTETVRLLLISRDAVRNPGKGKPKVKDMIQTYPSCVCGSLQDRAEIDNDTDFVCTLDNTG